LTKSVGEAGQAFFIRRSRPSMCPHARAAAKKKFALKIDIYQRICGEQD